MQVTKENYSEVLAQLKEQYGNAVGFEAELNGEPIYGFIRKPSRNELFSFLDNVSAKPMTAMAFMFDLIAIRECTHPIFFSDDEYYGGAVPNVSEFVKLQKVALKKS